MTITGNYRVWHTATGDFNGDGISDVYMLNTGGGGGATLCYGANATTTLNCVAISTGSTFSGSRSMHADDFNGDGRADLFIVRDPTGLGATSGVACLSPTILTTLANYPTTCTSLSVSQGTIGSVRVADYDGDQFAEILLATSWIVSSSPTTVYAHAYYRCTLASGCAQITLGYQSWGGFGFAQEMVSDYNSDGYLDLIVLGPFNTASDWKFCPGPLKYPNPVCTSMPKLSQAVENPGTSRLKVVAGDFNGDQMNDLIIMDDVQNGASNVFFCRGPDFLVTASACTRISGLVWTADIPFVGDYDGDGVSDLELIGTDHADFAKGGASQTDLMNSAVSGQGSQTSIAYRSLAFVPIFFYTKGTGASYPVVDLAMPHLVVSELNTSNGVGSTNRRSFVYQGARGHIQGRGFLGFERILTYENYVAGIPTHFTETWFSQNTSSFACIGSPWQVNKAVNIGGWKTYNAVTNNLATLGTGGTAQHCYTSSSTETNYEPSQASNPSTTQFTVTNSNVDVYGNVGRIDVTSTDGYTKSTINNFSNDATNWILGRLTCSAVTNTVPGGTPKTRTSSFVYESHGSLSREVVEPGTGCIGAPAADTTLAFRLITDYGYDQWGNKTSSTASSAVLVADPAYFVPRSSFTTYDARGQFPISSQNALGQSETYEHDPKFGGQTKLKGPNLLETSWFYDDFGRKIQETRADLTTTTWQYYFCNCPGYSENPNISYTVRETSTGPAPLYTQFDILNRVVMTGTANFNLQTINKSNIWYDALGRIATSYRPYIQGNAKYGTTYQYDALGRVTRESRPNGGTTDYSFLGLTSITNVAGTTISAVTVESKVSGANTVTQYTRKFTNSQGQTLQVLNGYSSTAESGIKYEYDHFGNLTRTKDAKGNIIQLTYDLRGNKKTMNDPDMGAWSYSYDALGQLKSQTDAKAQNTSMVYDKLGRMTQRNEPGMISNWHYDKYANSALCSKGIGKLCEVVNDRGYRRVHTYDNLGRSFRTDNYVDGTTNSQQIETTYDSASRVATVTYPAVTIAGVTTRLTIKNTYQAAGYLASITNLAGTQTYWSATAMDADGHVTDETLGNTVVTARRYDATTGRLSSINSGSGTVQNMTFTYDTIGNLTGRTDSFTLPSAATINETFSYDALNRLKTVSMTGTTTLTKSYDYDQIGNIIRKSDIGGTGVFTYPASGAGSVRPHAVSSVNGVINGVTNPSYTYDANGNMITAFAGTRVITYASFNLPTRMTRNGVIVDWVYDADHNRIKETSTAGITGNAATIYYVNPGNQPLFERHENIAGSGTTEYRHFIAGVAVYIQSTSTDPAKTTTKYMLKDHLGSTTVVTSIAGGVLERFSYDPFGKPRNLNGSDTASTTFRTPSLRRGFTGHEMLPEIGGGLIHMNGRIYDPNLGRFMTPDDVIPDPEDSQSFNRYSYVFNNPLSMTDPDGHCPVCLVLIAFAGGAATAMATSIVTVVAIGATFGAMAAGVASDGDPRAMLQGAVIGGIFAYAGAKFGGGSGASNGASARGDTYWNATANASTSTAQSVLENPTITVWAQRLPIDPFAASFPVSETGAIAGGITGSIGSASNATIVAMGPPGCLSNSFNCKINSIVGPPTPSGAGGWGGGGRLGNGSVTSGVRGPGTSSTPSQNATSGRSEFYRGAKPGESPSLAPQPKDFKVDPKTGFVNETRGPSVFDNPLSVRSTGRTPYQVDQSSIPDSLRIIQRGADPHHFEIVPRPGANLTPQQFFHECSSIVCVK